MTRSVMVAQTILLAAWLGAVTFLGAFVAPGAFAVLPTRALAGAVVGRALAPLFLAGMVTGLLVTFTSWVGRRSIAGALMGVTLVMSCAMSHLVIGPRISVLRQAIGPSLDALSPSDPRRVMFGRLHALSVAGLGIGTLAAVASLWLVVSASRRPDRRTEV